MQTDQLKQKIKNHHIILREILNKLDKLENAINYCEQGEELFIQEQISHEDYQFRITFKKLYFLIIEFLEQNKSYEILKIFKLSYNNLFDENAELMAHQFIEDYEDYYYVSPMLNNLEVILEPFEILNQNDNLSLLYLENILESSGYLVENLIVNSTNETSVYNCVKTVLKAMFNDYKVLSEPFSKVAKCYKPDILIPSARACIEYKFAKTEQRLVNTIGEIYEDVHGYSNHPEYKNFYAVFYTQNFTFIKHRFDKIIYEKNFPKNWKFILVNGK